MLRRFALSYRTCLLGSQKSQSLVVQPWHVASSARSLITRHYSKGPIPFTANEDGYVIAFTDGACKSNGTTEAKAGIGVWFGDNHPMNLSEPLSGDLQTNNFAEIQAARRAILIVKDAGIKKLNIKTDSQFLINCVTKWIHQWRRNGWKLSNGKPVKNREELEKLFSAARGIKLVWSYVPAHSGFHGNTEADRLAVEGCQK